MPTMMERLTLKALLPQLPKLREDTLGFLLELASQGDRFLVQPPLAPPIAFLFDPEGVEKALLAKGNKRTFQYRSLMRLTGRGLLVDDGQSWKEARLALKDPFLPKAMPGLKPILEEEAERALEEWRPGRVNLEEKTLELALRFLGRAHFGEALPTEIVKASLEGLKEVMAPTKTPWLLLHPGHHLALRRAKRRLEKEALSLIHTPLLRSLPRGRALAEGITLLVAGHETTASALSWSLYLLMKHPGKVPAVLESETYARWTFQEALRLYPPAWILTRRLEEPLDLDGWRLPKGSLLVLSPYATQRTHHPDPLEFRPERFQKAPRPGAYFPFGLGGRTCLGKHFALLEGEVALRAILRRFELRLLEEPSLEAGVTLRPKGGLWAEVRRRP
ncbi:MAG: cytochrome P450 [Thermaceae bacterium]